MKWRRKHIISSFVFHIFSAKKEEKNNINFEEER